MVTYRGPTDVGQSPADGVKVLSGLTPHLQAATAGLSELIEVQIEAGASTPSALGLATAVDLLVSAGDPSRRPTILWITDGLPNTDLAGRSYRPEAEVSAEAVDLYTESGVFLSPARVAWTGSFLGELGTYAGQPIADTMVEILRARERIPELMILPLALQGDGLETPRFSEDLLQFGAQMTAGEAFSADHTNDLLAEVAELLSQLTCETTP